MLACGYSNRNTSAVRTFSSIQFRQLAAPAISSLILMSSRVSFSSACRDNFRRLASSPYFVLWLRNIFSSFITRLSHALINRKPPFGRYRHTRLLNQSSSRCAGGVDTDFEFGHFFYWFFGIVIWLFSRSISMARKGKFARYRGPPSGIRKSGTSTEFEGASLRPAKERRRHRSSN